MSVLNVLLLVNYLAHMYCQDIDPRYSKKECILKTVNCVTRNDVNTANVENRVLDCVDFWID